MSKCYPIISMEDREDERADSVCLASEGEEWKTTVEALEGGGFTVVEWETYETGGVVYWFDRSSFTIEGNTIEAIWTLTRPPPLVEKP